MSLGIASIWRIALQKAIITHNIHVSSYFSMRCHVLHRVSQEEKAFSGLTLASHRQSLNGGPKRSSPALAVERRRNWCGVRRTLSLSRTRYPTVGMLRVPPTKYAPARVLPLHPSAVEALRHYQTIRRKRFPFTRRFFVGPYGRHPLSSSAAQRTFHHLVYDIPGNGARPRPRLYDFRHTFVTTLVSRWSRQANPIAQRLVLLSRYLGHKYFHHTYWYVQQEGEALSKASARFNHYRKRPRSGRL